MAEANDFVRELEALKQMLSVLEALNDDQRKFVLKAAADRFGLIIPKNENFENISDAQNHSVQFKANENIANITPKEFIKIKNPDSDVLRVACLAYYLTYARNQPHFKSEEIAKLNTEAAYQNFGNHLKTVNNTMTRSHFLAPAGNGKKQITAHGEDVVNSLPNKEAVAELIKKDLLQKSDLGEFKIVNGSDQIET
jgi:hypothetical protein